jgi:hypothetical protein
VIRLCDRLAEPVRSRWPQRRRVPATAAPKPAVISEAAELAAQAEATERAARAEAVERAVRAASIARAKEVKRVQQVAQADYAALVPCRYCGADVGEPCKQTRRATDRGYVDSREGRPASRPHSQRLEDAQEVQL